MTAEDICILALARVAIFTSNYPSTRSLMYRRIGLRQRAIFAKAAKANPDYHGVYATADLTAGAADLNDVVEPTPTPSALQRVTILDKGTNPDVENGDEVHIVPLADPESAIPPRATLRDLVLEGYNGELDGVDSIRVDYSKLPRVLIATDKTYVIELVSPYDELLVVDLTQYLLSLTTEMDDAKKEKALALLAAEETELFGDFMSHVAGYAPTEDRFSRPPSGAAQDAE